MTFMTLCRAPASPFTTLNAPRRPQAAFQPLRRQHLCVRASTEQQGEQQQSEAVQSQQQTPQQAAPPPATPTPPPARPVDPSVAKGQRTAIVTGAISIIFGVLYLALVQFMDSRGGQLLPPPPEAYEQY